MAESLRGGLSLSLCGFGFWSHDICGFEGTASGYAYQTNAWVLFLVYSPRTTGCTGALYIEFPGRMTKKRVTYSVCLQN